MKTLPPVVSYLVNFLLNKLYRFLWIFIHFVYRLQFDIREAIQTNWRYFFRRLTSCFPIYSYYGELSSLATSTEKLHKLPRHIAFSVTECLRNDVSNKNEELLDLQSLARVVSWAWVARIPVVSLYDYNGIVKKSYRELGCYIQEELIQSYWAVKKDGRAEEPPTIKFHNVSRVNGYTNGVASNGVTKGETFHIVVFSYEDGKPEIIRAIKRLYLEHIQSNQPDSTSGDHSKPDRVDPLLTISQLDEAKWDSFINSHHASWAKVAGSTDPDVLVIFGHIKSTLGFLPWHIRLTEIHWLPKLENTETSDFLSVLRKYSNCQQRFGT